MGVRAGALVGRAVGAFVLAVVLLVVSTASAIWWTARQDSRPSSDAIVVLGSAQYNGVPSSIFEARLEHEGSGYAVTRAKIALEGRTICDADLRFRSMPFPAGLDAQGLPLGLQVIGRAFDEETVFAVGAALERAAAFDALPAVMAGRGAA